MSKEHESIMIGYVDEADLKRISDLFRRQANACLTDGYVNGIDKNCPVSRELARTAGVLASSDVPELRAPIIARCLILLQRIHVVGFDLIALAALDDVDIEAAIVHEARHPDHPDNLDKSQNN